MSTHSLISVSQFKVRDTFFSYGVMELCTRGLGGGVPQLKARGVSLGCVYTLVVVAEERPRIALTFTQLFAPLGQFIFLNPLKLQFLMFCPVDYCQSLYIDKQSLIKTA